MVEVSPYMVNLKTGVGSSSLQSLPNQNGLRDQLCLLKVLLIGTYTRACDFDPADLAREASSSPTNARGANRQVQTPAFHDHSDRVHHCDPADALSSYIIRHFLSGLHFDITKVSSRDPLADNQLETEVATGANIDTVALRLCLLMISDVEACRDVRTGNETAWV
ncbi:hypothetical protein PGT21_003241 [Puccinia graminis f. sp. tritici]|uniref:Uncharacterized protein n=1 Tax=Puccinia graminis f. sp. tritici TaxID=56615 RepID=A0A5B0QWP2_PUCGR|nr:hypothetical protein PGT21_003241 [Puccinia graminis f. sp. tritici]